MNTADLKGWGAILCYKWEIRHCIKEDKIIGYWAEDGNEYEIIVPNQLKEILVGIQNWLSDIYNDINKLKNEAKRLGHIFDERSRY